MSLKKRVFLVDVDNILIDNEGIKNLRKLGKVIVYGAEKIVGKKKGVIKIVSRLRKEGYENITLIDDVSDVLVEGFKAYSKIISVWIRYGKYKNKLPIIRSAISQETQSFEEAVHYLQNFVANISPKKSHLKFSILKVINEYQIKDLIEYTKKDKIVHLCTRDIERFKNPKTFGAWIERKKVIYTMISTKGRLLGIIWFAKKPRNKFDFTMAIRIYPPARGKGMAQKFMEVVFENFKESTIFKNSKNKGFWLETREKNIRAVKLYTKFGFKKTAMKNNEILMTLD